jgi:hypothetical protein
MKSSHEDQFHSLKDALKYRTQAAIVESTIGPIIKDPLPPPPPIQLQPILKHPQYFETPRHDKYDKLFNPNNDPLYYEKFLKQLKEQELLDKNFTSNISSEHGTSFMESFFEILVT